MDSRRADATIAALLAIASLIELAPQLHRSERPALAVAAAVAIPGTVAWRRRAPFAAAAVALVLFAAFERVAFIRDYGLFLVFAVMLEIYSVAANIPGRRGLAAGAAVLALVLVAVGADPTGADPYAYIYATFLLFGLPFAVGRALLNRRALTRELRDKAARMERRREERASEAVAVERARVARELHDVLAHSVSVMVIQTGAARRVAATDRDAAREALRSVQTSGREALAEMRRMVGIARRAEVGDEIQARGLGQLQELIARARAAGLPVELRLEGERADLSAGVDLAAYRVVQEALTNTLKHAGPARARVLVRYRADTLELEVSDTGRGPRPDSASIEGAGHGLIGMRERVALYDGRLEAGRRRDGGFVVRAQIPLHGVPA
jgi:signal transduction histidine kinase